MRRTPWRYDSFPLSLFGKLIVVDFMRVSDGSSKKGRPTHKLKLKFIHCVHDNTHFLWKKNKPTAVTKVFSSLRSKTKQIITGWFYKVSVWKQYELSTRQDWIKITNFCYNKFRKNMPVDLLAWTVIFLQNHCYKFLSILRGLPTLDAKKRLFSWIFLIGLCYRYWYKSC